MKTVQAPEYEDLVLALERAGEGYRLSLRGLHCGETATSFQVPDKLKNFASLLAQLESHIATRNLPSGMPDQLREIGSILFEALFGGPIRDGYLTSRGRVESQSNAGLRLQLSTAPNAVDLLGLPWELLYHRESREFLARTPLQSIVRRVAVPRLKPLPGPCEDIRVLLASATPKGLPELKAESECRRLCQLLESRGIHSEIIPHATVGNLERTLRHKPFEVFHFLGHGHFDRRNGAGCVVLENSRGHPNLVSGDLLAELLSHSPDLRLVLLGSCQSARLPRREGRDPFSSMATALILAGLPAVLAMQFPVSDAAARLFSRAFYESLVVCPSVDRAVSEGRRTVYLAQPDTWEWITPSLFRGSPDGKLFAAASSHPTSEQRSAQEPTPMPDGHRLSNITGSGVFLGDHNTYGDVRIGQPCTLKEEGAERYRHGLRQLDRNNYRQAQAILEKAVQVTEPEPDACFWLALARLAGRSPRLLRLDSESGRSESVLTTSTLLMSCCCGP